MTPLQIVDALRMTRGEFSDAFRRSQTGIPTTRRMAFEALEPPADDRMGFLLALVYAEKNGFLRSFALVAVDARLENGAISTLVGPELTDPTAAIQRMTNDEAGLPHSDVLWRGQLEAMRWTARIDIGGVIKGTGFLVGPNLLMTAWHVVRSLFDTELKEVPCEKRRSSADSRAAAGACAPDPPPRATETVTPSCRPEVIITHVPKTRVPDLRIIFDDRLTSLKGGLLGPYGPLSVEADDDWHVRHSACHDAELADTLPANVVELDGRWDYCVIRLKTLPGLERRWAALETRAACPPVRGSVHLFHHPSGQSMRTNTGNVAPFAHGYEAAEGIRFLHTSNSLRGSSGGPCFDDEYSLFGLHQGEWPSAPVDKTNRGVPIFRIAQEIERDGGLPFPDATKVPILTLQGELKLPIVGRDDVQAITWKSIAKTSTRLITIGGAAGSGKTFCADIMRSMLSDRDHLKIVVPAESLAHVSAEECVTMFARAAGADLKVVQVADVASTAGAWRRDQLVPDLLDAIERIRSGRTVWLFVTDLNAVRFQRPDVGDMILSIAEQIAERAWLRMVLDGFRGDLPGRLRMPGEYMCRTIEVDQIRNYLMKFAANEGIAITDGEAMRSANVMHGRYVLSLQRDDPKALETLSGEVLALCVEYQRKR